MNKNSTLTGTIKRLNPKKENAIISLSNGIEINIHYSSITLEKNQPLVAGQLIQFELAHDENEIPSPSLPLHNEEQQKRNNDIYIEIINNWNVDAKKEDSAYFYNIQEVKSISDGRKSYVIGRKGSGKTAIAQYLSALKEHDIFVEKLSFKNFPFNILYALHNNHYTAPNQYVSLWKYLIYSNVCKKMMSNESINIEIRTKLSNLYSDSPKDALDKVIKRWSSKEFGVELLGAGFSYVREKMNKIYHGLK